MIIDQETLEDALTELNQHIQAAVLLFEAKTNQGDSADIQHLSYNMTTEGVVISSSGSFTSNDTRLTARVEDID